MVRLAMESASIATIGLLNRSRVVFRTVGSSGQHRGLV